MIETDPAPQQPLESVQAAVQSASASTAQPPLAAPVPPQPPVPAVTAGRDPVKVWLTILSVVVGVQLLATIGAVLAIAIPMGLFFGLEGDDYLTGDTIAMDVAYYVQTGDVEGYMDLYPEGDSTVDRDAVRADFEAAAASIDTSANNVEYMTDSIVLYEDEETGEQIARIRISGMNFETGGPRGKRLTFWAVLGDEPDTVLTGQKGRDLGEGKSVW